MLQQVLLHSLNFSVRQSQIKVLGHQASSPLAYPFLDYNLMLIIR